MNINSQKKNKFQYLVLLVLLLTIASCSGMQYKQSNDLPGDVRQASGNNTPYRKSDLVLQNYKLGQEDWQAELTRIKRDVGMNTVEYDVLSAHCYRNLEQHDKAAESFVSASKKAKNSKFKSRMQKEAIRSYRDSGLAAELLGNYSAAASYYEECNRYCEINGFGTHIPHSKIDHLKMLAKEKK